MTIQEVNDIIKKDHLENYVKFDEEYGGEKRAVICKRGNLWGTYYTSERGWPEDGTLRTFDNLSDALDDFISLARLMKLGDMVHNKDFQ